MISVVIPTLNAADRLALCLNALGGAAVDGLVKEVIVVDGGSSDETLNIADKFGATVLTAPANRGGQLSLGAKHAHGDWILFLHGDTVLEPGWAIETKEFIAEAPKKAGVFSLVFEAKGLAPKFVAAGAMVRTKLLKSPYGDQGLLISRKMYDEVGGYKTIPLMEDVEIIHHIVERYGRKALHVFDARAVTSAARYERDGYLKRAMKNIWTLARYHAGVSPEKLASTYK